MGNNNSVPLVTKKSSTLTPEKEIEEIETTQEKDDFDIWLADLGFDKLYFSDIIQNINLITLTQIDKTIISNKKFENILKSYFKNDLSLGEKMFNFYNMNEYFYSSDEENTFSINLIINSLLFFSNPKKMTIKENDFLYDKAFYIYQRVKKTINQEQLIVIEKKDYEEYLNLIYTNMLDDNIIKLYDFKQGKLKYDIDKIINIILNERDKIIENLIYNDSFNDNNYLTIYDINNKFNENQNYLKFNDILRKVFQIIIERGYDIELRENEENNQYDNKKKVNNQYENKKYENKKYENKRYENKNYENKRYDNNQYDNNQYENNQYENNQYENNQYENNQSENNQYENKKYENNQYENIQYDNIQYENNENENNQNDKIQYENNENDNIQYEKKKYENNENDNVQYEKKKNENNENDNIQYENNENDNIQYENNDNNENDEKENNEKENNENGNNENNENENNENGNNENNENENNENTNNVNENNEDNENENNENDFR